MKKNAKNEGGRGRYLWFVRHPEHCQAPVIAEDREGAVMEAARLWGVRWQEIMCDADVDRRQEARKHLCARCGSYIYGEDKLCASCLSILQVEEQRIKEAKRNYYKRNAGEIRRIMKEAKCNGAAK